MTWSYQPHQAYNPFFKLSQIVGYSHMVTELIQFVLM